MPTSNPLVSVAIEPPEVAETTTKPLPALLQKRSSGGCTVHRYALVELKSAGYIVSRRDILFG